MYCDFERLPYIYHTQKKGLLNNTGWNKLKMTTINSSWKIVIIKIDIELKNVSVQLYCVEVLFLLDEVLSTIITF